MAFRCSKCDEYYDEDYEHVDENGRCEDCQEEVEDE